MDDFQRDVIDRLARIEENAKSGVNLAAIVLAQGLRIDTLERRMAQFKDRMWGVVIIATVFLPQAVTWLRVQFFGAFPSPH